MLNNESHGACKGRKVSGSYTSWKLMKQRCLNKNNPDYKHYGGRGITICQSWIRFENFLADMGERPELMSIDRIDNEGNYCKENCRWATQKTQTSNSRRNVYITKDGEKVHLSGWAEKLGISNSCLEARVKRGWDNKRTLEKKSGEWRKNGIYITHQGNTLNVFSWSKKTGFSYGCLWNRIRTGWSVDQMLSIKPRSSEARRIGASLKQMP